MTAKKLPYRPCVGIMLVNAGGLVFTGERLDTPGAWQMPQGGIDKGEDAETAAIRELGEEIGVAPDDVTILSQTQGWITYDLPPHLYGKMWGGRFGGQKQRWFLMRLEADDSAINIATSHPEFGQWKWTAQDRLVAEIVPFKRHVYEQVINELLG